MFIIAVDQLKIFILISSVWETGSLEDICFPVWYLKVVLSQGFYPEPLEPENGAGRETRLIIDCFYKFIVY